MKLDENLFEAFDEEDIAELEDQEADNLSDIENKIANLQPGDEEIVIKMKTPIMGLTNDGFNTLHIIKRTPDGYRIWNEDDDGAQANIVNFSSFDNTLYWATLASQGDINAVKENPEEVEETEETVVVEEDFNAKDFDLEDTYRGFDIHKMKFTEIKVGDKSYPGFEKYYISFDGKFFPDEVYADRKMESIQDAKDLIDQIIEENPRFDKGIKEDLEVAVDGEEVEQVGDLEVLPEPTDAQINFAYRNQFIELINGEWDTIQDYNDLINNLREIEEYKEFIPVIEGIIKDEHNHIGNLQNVLDKLNPQSNKDLEDGDKEAQEILDGDKIDG